MMAAITAVATLVETSRRCVALRCVAVCFKANKHTSNVFFAFVFYHQLG